MIDLKEDDEKYAKAITGEVREYGEPKRLVLGIRSVEHANQFRKLLPEARQIGLVPKADDTREIIGSFLPSLADT